MIFLNQRSLQHFDTHNTATARPKKTANSAVRVSAIARDVDERGEVLDEPHVVAVAHLGAEAAAAVARERAHGVAAQRQRRPERRLATARRHAPDHAFLADDCAL